MKTLREVLLDKHQAAQPGLDAIREQVIAGLTAGRGANASTRSQRMGGGGLPIASALQAGWRQFLWSLRWHLAGMSAAWLVALALNMDPTPAPAKAVTRQDAASSQQLLATLRQNQRQLRELIAAPISEPAPGPLKFAPSPRSQIHSLPTAAA